MIKVKSEKNSFALKIQCKHNIQIKYVISVKKKLKFFFKICELELKLFLWEDKNQIYTELTNYDLVYI